MIPAERAFVVATEYHDEDLVQPEWWLVSNGELMDRDRAERYAVAPAGPDETRHVFALVPVAELDRLRALAERVTTVTAWFEIEDEQLVEREAAGPTCFQVELPEAMLEAWREARDEHDRLSWEIAREWRVL